MPTTHTATGNAIPVPMREKTRLSHDDYRMIADAYVGHPEDDLLDAKREVLRDDWGVDTIANALIRRYNAHNASIEMHSELADGAIQALQDLFLER